MQSMLFVIALFMCFGCSEIYDTESDSTNETKDSVIEEVVSEEYIEKQDMTFTDAELSTVQVNMVDGYSNLQSFFMSIDGNDKVLDVTKKAKKFGLYAYEYDGGAGFWGLQIAETKWTSKGYGSEQYSFDGDYMWITFDTFRSDKYTAQMQHAYYKKKIGYDVEFNVKGNVVGNHYQVMQGIYALDPTAEYKTAKDALDVVLTN